MDKKRTRSVNWDEEEKQLFRSVFKEYSQIIENKSLDTNSNKIKTEAWEKVYKKFNEINSRHRELSQLKIQWKGMKIRAKKTYGTYNRERNKTGGGERPPTPDDAVIEIKDLLNPAELLKDHNIYDSDGIIPSSSENKIVLTTTTNETLQDSKPVTYVVETLDSFTDTNSQENQQIADICIETKGVDAQVKVQEFTPFVISQDNATPTHTATPMKKKSMNSVQNEPKRKIMLNNIPKNGLKSRKNHNDYINIMTSHSKMLKDKEHSRLMEMAEEEHAIKMAIHQEKLMSATIERQILELKKVYEENMNNNINN